MIISGKFRIFYLRSYQNFEAYTIIKKKDNPFIIYAHYYKECFGMEIVYLKLSFYKKFKNEFL